MKLSNNAKILLEEKRKIKYDMKHINGGFSDGVEIKPGQHAGLMNISVDIYGGSNGLSHPHQVPQSIRELQEAYIAAAKTGNPSATDFKPELEAYYTNLKRAISFEIVRLIQQFDQGASTAIATAVQKINEKYQ
jgi:hypothetical protein